MALPLRPGAERAIVAHGQGRRLWRRRPAGRTGARCPRPMGIRRAIRKGGRGHASRGGIARPIIVFTPILRTEIDSLRRADLTPALGDPAVIESWARTGRPWHLQIDTGMSRAGMPWHQVAEHYVADRALGPRRGPDAFPFGGRRQYEPGRAGASDSPRRFDTRCRRRQARCTRKMGCAVERRAPSKWTVFLRPGIFLAAVATVSMGRSLRPEPVASVRGRIVEIRTIAMARR